jgi:hypothetical protein
VLAQLTAGKFKTSATSERAKSRLCILTLGLDNSGPAEFVGWFKHEKWFIDVVKNLDRPIVWFTTKKYSPGKGMNIDNVGFSIAIDIEDGKVGGHGWKSKLEVGWAMDQGWQRSCSLKDFNGDSAMGGVV